MTIKQTICEMLGNMWFELYLSFDTENRRFYKSIISKILYRFQIFVFYVVFTHPNCMEKIPSHLEHFSSFSFLDLNNVPNIQNKKNFNVRIQCQYHSEPLANYLQLQRYHIMQRSEQHYYPKMCLQKKNIATCHRNVNKFLATVRTFFFFI